MSETTYQPFFSIVIPTKGRANLLVDAIGSVLQQDFSDYELIVSDNFNDERTKQTIDLFKENLHIRYFRTESELNMPQHWEFATTKARGKYVLVLTDRSVLKQHALATINKELVAHSEIAICSWRWTFFDEISGIETGEATDQRMQGIELLTTSFVAQDFTRKSVNYPYSLPRGLNSCYRTDLAKLIREKHGALFMTMAPDYSSSFLLLAYADEILYINKSLFLSHALNVSTGGISAASTALKYIESLHLLNPYQYVPIKAPIVENVMFSDFIMVKEMTNGNLKNVEIDWVEYFVACYREILAKVWAGVLSKSDIKQMTSLWENALESFDKNIQAAVKARLRPVKLLLFLKRSFIGPTLIHIKRRLEILRLGGRPSRYKTVMDAAGFCNVMEKS